MKALVMLIFILCIAVSILFADTCVRHQVHTDGYYYGGRVNPPVDREYEVWFGTGKIAYMHERRSVLFDLDKSIMTFVNLEDSTYVVSPIPFEWTKLLVPQDTARVLMYQTVGEISKTDGKKKVLDRKCMGYTMCTWIPYEGGRVYETDATVWVTSDVPFNLELYEMSIGHRLQLQNYKSTFIDEMNKIKGYPLLSEESRFVKGFSVKSFDRVVEILEKDPPAGVYAIPAGFTKKAQLGIGDLRGG
ncbi:MAG: hypothetical protein JSV33_05625 [bacterium]|nr:MAG: hypothetical protein JSV33_05625 [bacterium]